MSRLGDYENAIVSRLETANIGGVSAFDVISGASGGWRPAIREALSRERGTAAYVAFVEEPTAPEVRDSVRGAKFSVLVAARTARIESNARHGDGTAFGAFALIDAARSRLDEWHIAAGIKMVNVHVKFLDADERLAVYEILYRIWPIVVDPAPAAIVFDGSPIFGADSRMMLEAGPRRPEEVAFEYHGRDAVYSMTLGPDARTIVIRGDLRAVSHAALNVIEAGIESAIGLAKSGLMDEGGVRDFDHCTIAAFFRRGGRRTEGAFVVQSADVLIVQSGV